MSGPSRRPALPMRYARIALLVMAAAAAPASAGEGEDLRIAVREAGFCSSCHSPAQAQADAADLCGRGREALQRRLSDYAAGGDSVMSRLLSGLDAVAIERLAAQAAVLFADRGPLCLPGRQPAP